MRVLRKYKKWLSPEIFLRVNIKVMSKKQICKIQHMNHICIAVKDIDASIIFYEQMFGVTPSEVEVIEDQGVKAALLRIGGSQIEFIQPLDLGNSIGRFIENRGEAVHHICFEVNNLQQKLDSMGTSGVRLIDESPREGLSGMIAFIHPKSTNGILYELVDSDTARR